jgi:hypothetical protein
MPVGSLQQAISIIVLSPYRIFVLIFIPYEKLHKYNAIFYSGNCFVQILTLFYPFQLSR